MKMAKKNLFPGALVTALVFACFLGSCNTGTNSGGDDPFVAVTGIIDVPTAAIVGTELTLTGTVKPDNAANKTIVWSGSNVSNGKLTAPSAGTYTVTATIANGKSESGPYTKDFNITAYDTSSAGDTNPFGSDTKPFYWAMDGKGGTVYVILKSSTWESKDAYSANSPAGTYTHFTGTRGAEWIIGAGDEYEGYTGLVIIDQYGKMIVANLPEKYGYMNQTFTKIDTTLKGDGTWLAANIPFNGSNVNMKIVAANGTFTQSINGKDIVQGTYPITGNTNPAVYTMNQVNTGVFTGSADSWKQWNTLTPVEKNHLGGSQTQTLIIYPDKLETQGFTFQKQNN
jgi:hypothetical protein